MREPLWISEYIAIAIHADQISERGWSSALIDAIADVEAELPVENLRPGKRHLRGRYPVAYPRDKGPADLRTI
ncbi:hypothetical protein [[Phormidium] sp. ETS-05]|uniref:hypothetical protein n=1 Tax=[Phormidium] sp. ETS-05 TaxID=222819 RepID=UPI0018EED429|nr:hypothetical protein [[Phormidium] sp. ETS-05]